MLNYSKKCLQGISFFIQSGQVQVTLFISTVYVAFPCELITYKKLQNSVGIVFNLFGCDSFILNINVPCKSFY